MYFYYFVTATNFLGLKKLFNTYKLMVTSVQMIQVLSPLPTPNSAAILNILNPF
jgi:hypothetical protein